MHLFMSGVFHLVISQHHKGFKLLKTENCKQEYGSTGWFWDCSQFEFFFKSYTPKCCLNLAKCWHQTRSSYTIQLSAMLAIQIFCDKMRRVISSGERTVKTHKQHKHASGTPKVINSRDVARNTLSCFVHSLSTENSKAHHKTKIWPVRALNF